MSTTSPYSAARAAAYSRNSVSTVLTPGVTGLVASRGRVAGRRFDTRGRGGAFFSGFGGSATGWAGLDTVHRVAPIRRTSARLIRAAASAARTSSSRTSNSPPGRGAAKTSTPNNAAFVCGAKPDSAASSPSLTNSPLVSARGHTRMSAPRAEDTADRVMMIAPIAVPRPCPCRFFMTSPPSLTRYSLARDP
jgi:hypothetical protein